MREDFARFMSGLEEVKAPPHLAGAIFGRIRSEKRRKQVVRFGLSSASALTSCIGLVPVLRYTAEELSRSGFLAYLSLLISDRAIAFSQGSTFALSLLESAPLLAITLSLAGILTFLASLRFALTHIYDSEGTLAVS